MRLNRILFFVLSMFSIGLLIACTAGPDREPAAVSSTRPIEDQSDTPTAAASEIEVTDTVTAQLPATPTFIPSRTPSPTVTPAVAASGEVVAYLQGSTLAIRPLGGGAPISVETCPEDSYCILQYLKWSPDGQHLLYYYYDGQEDSLRLADRAGNVQIISDDVDYVRPGAWSPDGRSIAFIRPTEEISQGSDSEPPTQVSQVWTAALGEGGTVEEPQMVGAIHMTMGGCGGGGRSPSEVLYENEGGTSYGYLMGVTEWTSQDILLYTLDCTNVGIGRFDMNNTTQLEPFDIPLRNLVLNSTNDRWYAVTGPAWSTELDSSHQIATGTPDSTEVTVIPTSQPVELVFYGVISNRLYYTTRELVEQSEVPDQGLYFSFFKAGLWTILPDGSNETELWQSEDQAYANVTERASGNILFTLVENDRPLYEAAQDPAITDLTSYMPQRHIVEIPANGGQPAVIIENAGQPELSNIP